jgi:hypothetical protein
MEIKDQAIRQWLSDYHPRLEINSHHNSLGEGTASNFINDWNKGLDSDHESTRELAIQRIAFY